ncbi:cupin domain-containing protein [Cloacibacillus evryensis]|uniref:cupin domain-containing protein n=1 Tax=Cloacibacillus evryensis TaxID=508460 RepID=UPI0004B4D643|nr:cupin domain-containing protein [Cloacibacillus evryensis]MEA5034755.1 cupin domain-containing protein [Cloacibacillus evryensis]
MFVLDSQIASEELGSGAIRKIKGYIDDLMLVELTWKAGQEGVLHHHPHRQCDYVVKGSFEVTLGDEKKILGPGDCFYVKADVPHGVKALEDGGILLDIFTPMREDFIK